LKRARELASIRNDIAHNPVMLNLYLHESTPDMLFEHCITTARGGKTIDLAGVKATMWLQIGKVAESSPGDDA
jgi:hypothetical protein